MSVAVLSSVPALSSVLLEQAATENTIAPARSNAINFFMFSLHLFNVQFCFFTVLFVKTCFLGRLPTAFYYDTIICLLKQ